MWKKERPRYQLVDRVVISLEDSTERRDRFFSSPSATGFRIFPAFDGRSGEIPDFFDTEKFFNISGKPPTPGEVGCAASHYMVIRDFASSKGSNSDLILIAEDDAILSKNLDFVISKILEKSSLLDYCVLADAYGNADLYSLDSPAIKICHHSLFSRPIFIKGEPYIYKIGYFSGILYGAGLYLMSRKAAKIYVDYVERVGKMYWVSDQYDYWPDRMGIKVSLLRPNLAEYCGDSTVRKSPAVWKLFQKNSTTVKKRLPSILWVFLKIVRRRALIFGKVKGIYEATINEVKRFE
ncbi:glycosyltransferase family 25 protein [Dermabacteraceae bacterium P7074]